MPNLQNCWAVIFIIRLGTRILSHHLTIMAGTHFRVKVLVSSTGIDNVYVAVGGVECCGVPGHPPSQVHEAEAVSAGIGCAGSWGTVLVVGSRSTHPVQDPLDLRRMCEWCWHSQWPANVSLGPVWHPRPVQVMREDSHWAVSHCHRVALVPAVSAGHLRDNLKVDHNYNT